MEPDVVGVAVYSGIASIDYTCKYFRERLNVQLYFIIISIIFYDEEDITDDENIDAVDGSDTASIDSWKTVEALF